MSITRSLTRPVVRKLTRSLSAAGAGGWRLAESIVISGVLADYVTFTRASTATRYNSAGLLETVPANQPRYDYDPTTVTRANLLLRSQEFDNASWSKAAGGTGSAPVVTSNYAVAPDGTMTADRVQLSLGGGTTVADQSVVSQSVTGITVGAAYQHSFYVKANGPSEVGKVIIARGAAGTSYQTITLTSDWQRVGRNETAAGTLAIVVIGLRGTFGSADTADFFVWGAQLEAGSVATDYIPTGVRERGPELVTVASATLTGATGYTAIASSPSVAGRAYEVTYTLNQTSGSTQLVVGSAVVGSKVGAVSGTFSAILVANDATGLRFYSSAAVGTASNFSIREVNADYNSPQGDATLRGMLIEEQRTNLLLRSQEFDDASWAKTNASVTANTAVAPDGTLTADTLTATTGGGDVNRSTSVTNGATYAASIFIEKTVGATQFPMLALNFSAVLCQVILNTNTGVANVRNGQTGAQGVAVQGSGNYWRVSFYGTSDGTNAVFRVFPAASTDGLNYNGTLTGSIKAWGAQVELGAFATSYIPTTSAAVTRAIDDPDFTIPAGIVRLEYTYDDDTTTDVAVTPGAAYQIPTGQKRIKHLRGYRS